MNETDAAIRRAFGMTDSAADPFGFVEMSIAELRQWMAERNAEPGSERYEHARLVLEGKIDRRDHLIRVAQIGAATFVGVAAIVVSVVFG